MNQCRRTAERLASYADEALPPAERAEVEQHLNACPPCRGAAEAEQAGRTVLRRCAPRLRAEALPPGLRTRCEALARARDAKGSVWQGRFVPALVVAVLLLITATALFSLATRQSNTLLAAQLTADHVKCFKVFEPEAEVDAKTLEAMLADEYGWDIHVPPSSPADGITLVGARRCLYADGSIPHVMYHVDGEEMSLFLLEGVTRQDADVTTLGHHSKIWSRGATTYVLVSPTGSTQHLASAMRYVMQEAH